MPAPPPPPDPPGGQAETHADSGTDDRIVSPATAEDEGGSRRSRWHAVARWGITVAALGLCVLLVQRMGVDKLLDALRHAHWPLVALGAFLMVTVNPLACIQRWRSLLGPLPRTAAHVPFGELAWLWYTAIAANNLLPARAGEALRVVQLNRRLGYPVGSTVAARFVEGIIVAVGMGNVAILSLIVGPPEALMAPVIIAAVAGPGSALVAVLVAWRWRPGPPAPLPEGTRRFSAVAVKRAFGSFFHRLGEAVRLTHRPRTWITTLLWSTLSDAMDLTLVWLCAAAVGIDLSIPELFVVNLGINLAVALPSTPGQVGVVEASAVLVLGYLGVDAAQALAFGLIFHAAQQVPVTLVGVVGLRRQWGTVAPRTVAERQAPD